MAAFAVIKASDAPKPPKPASPLNKRMREYEGYVAAVGAGKVGKLTLADGEKGRGTALRVTRAALRLNDNASAWAADGCVYFTVSQFRCAAVCIGSRAERAKRVVYNVRVLKWGTGWEVRRDGAGRASARAATRADAIERERSLATNHVLTQIRIWSTTDDLVSEFVDDHPDRFR